MMEQKEHCRLERDSIGTMEVPAEAYYGIQTLRAYGNFSITGQKPHEALIRSIVEIKKAAALTNLEAGELNGEKAGAIIKACDEILEGKLQDQFILDPIQGGAGTSFNMNANEVIANRAIELLGGKKGDYNIISPYDDVNCGQSTNDVYPSCGKIAVLRLLREAEEQLRRLETALIGKAEEFGRVIKMGRTQMQDAVPIRLGQEFQAYAAFVRRDRERFRRAMDSMRSLNMGGTAIGTGLNASREYYSRIVPMICRVTGEELFQSSDTIDSTQNLDGYTVVSGIVKTCAVNLSKMCNDLRLLSSGPRAGFGEICLPPKQHGSSIMPGKVNPVIPEVVNQAAFRIAGNDVSICMAVEAGQLELNAFEPLIHCCLIESVQILGNAIGTLVDNCVPGITANEEHCRQEVEESIGIITAICPHVGYEAAARLAKEALECNMPVRKLVLRDGLVGEKELNDILDPFAMTAPGIIGKKQEK